MADLFDPYRVWLGIPPEERPPNHYRLLGIGTFEDDADVISNAADRQMAHIRTFQSGKRSAMSQDLLNELSSAKICLLDPAKRAEYDQQLRTELPSAETAPPIEPPPYEPPVASPPVAPAAPVPDALRGDAPAAVPLASPAVPIAQPTLPTGDDAVPVGQAAVPVGDDMVPVGQLMAPTVDDTVPVGQAAVSTGEPAEPMGTPGSGNGAEVRPKKKVPAAGPVSADTVAPTTRRSTSMSSRTASRKNNSSIMPILIAGGALGAVILVVIIMSRSGSDPPVRRTPKSRTGGDTPAIKTNNVPVVNSKTVNRKTRRYPRAKKIPRDQRKFKDSLATMAKLPPQERVAYGLDATIAAMRRRDMATARDLLAASKSHSPTDQQIAKIERMTKLIGHVDAFWQAAVDAARHLKVGDRLDVEGDIVTVVAKSKRIVTVRRGGNKYRIELEKPKKFLAAFAEAFAARKLNLDDASSRLAIGVFLALDGHGDAGRAKALLLAAAAQDPLAKQYLLDLGLAEPPPVKKVEPTPPKVAKVPSKDPPAGGTKIDWSKFPFDRTARSAKPRPPLPDKSDLAAERSQVRSVLKEEFVRANRDPGAKAALARRLVTEAVRLTDKPKQRYVMLDEALQIWIELANAGGFLPVIDQMGQLYDVDVLNLKAISLTRASGKTTDRTVLGELVSRARGVYTEAMRVERFDIAARATRAATLMSRKASEPRQADQLEKRSKELERLHSEYGEVQASAKKLVTSPDDPPSNLVLGRYYCFHKNDWKMGLPLLAKGDNTQIKAAAAGDLANPTEPEAMVDVADRWLAQAKQIGTSKEPNRIIADRAVRWYRKALPKTEGLLRAKVQKRLSEIKGDQLSGDEIPGL